MMLRSLARARAPARSLLQQRITSVSRRAFVCAPPLPPLPTIEEIRRYGAGDLERARLTLSNALDSHSVLDRESRETRGNITRLLAATHLRLGDPLAAEELLDEHLGAVDDDMEAKFLLGVAYQKSGRAEDAMTQFESVLAADAGHWRARFHVALIALAEGEYDAAALMLLEVLEANPEHHEVRARASNASPARPAANIGGRRWASM